MLMGLKDKMKMHIFHNIGNGLATCVWFDKWDHSGPLSIFITKRDIYDARLNSNNRVAGLIEDARWKWPSEWLDMFPILKDIQVPSLNDSPDKVVWISSKGQQKDFSVKEAWKNVRTEYPKVSWHQIVWSSKCTPRHTFMWLALHGRLQTHDIMAKWNTGFNLSCSLCDETSDSISHLFFQCNYLKKVSGMPLERMGQEKNLISEYGVSSLVWAATKCNGVLDMAGYHGSRQLKIAEGLIH
ncbi:RNA-directed DNA polymerase, eukaryota, reverse transcriptase zinc-binding domain protein [Tanacetum coccineum]